MSVTNTHTAIPKSVATNDDLDFHYLRKLGIQYIEELGGSLWTDFNSHDPGITMLEMLCYAITDLGMRIDLPIENLLASDKANEQLSNQFYRASDIFPTKAITAVDYRKLFIDIEGVRNCWLRIAKRTVYADCKNDCLSYTDTIFEGLPIEFQREYDLKGLYTLLVDFEDLDDTLSDEEKEDKIQEIKDTILEKYHTNRSLCEDLIEIKEVPEKPISVCASVEVETEADEELIHAKILTAITNYFSTTLRFYSIKQMLDKGYTPDQIFDGPFLLDHGFIDPEELKEADLRSEVRLSDIMKLIMNIEGVKHINDISIGNCGSGEEQLNEWLICIPADTKPILCSDSVFSYNKGVLPLNINETQVDIYLEQLKEDAQIENEVPEDERDLTFPESTYLAPESYTTIQNDFPETYGIGQAGLSAIATNERKAQVKQLKGYLLFFDKVLASYFKHLGNVRELLSINGGLDKTYFTQVVEDIKDFEDLVNEYPIISSDATNEELTKVLFGQQDDTVDRRNKIVDHLLARFAEKFGDYTFLMKALFGTATNEIVLTNKKEFLNDYIAISSERGSAFNYYKQPKKKLWNTDNISGFQKRVSRLVGIKNYNRRVLSSSFVDIYSLENADLKTVFRWRIKDENKNIILSATEEYKTTAAANKELYFAVLQIIQTSEKEVQEACENGIEDETTIGNIHIHISDSGKYSFDVVNLDQPESSKDHIVAKQFKYYDTAAAIKKAILDIISFMKFKFTEEGIFLVEHILLRPEFPKEEDVIEEGEVSEESEVEIPEEVEEVSEDPKPPFLPICTDNCEDDCGIDPYSYRVSIVIPGYTYRFSNPDFRNYMENIIKEELPAHVLPKICWIGHRDSDLDNIKEQYLQQLKNEEVSTIKQLDDQIVALQNKMPPPEDLEAQIAALEAQKIQVPILIEERRLEYLDSIKDQTNDLVEFEKKYKAYLFAKTSLRDKQPLDELKGLLKALGDLNTIYPVGRLLDCDDESDELEGKIILGQTNIGTL
ncbi:hypothetical protein GCM10011344_25210 [Dokdonia pacifica]|uniref:DUF1508 domain-containing protein n=1 Tax=Dokdonia pacifica TaxID=1627892 RepID=A0A238WRH7_9FLAO|nr:DUF1508 domain-containing protein [Dokdonia pacifica]GGG23422.1 hypothetical protein GCM10011344_25210 [Dokdonia pacifica]SNR48953.1 protein of unknown function [Dokdonia pacifica]